VADAVGVLAAVVGAALFFFALFDRHDWRARLQFAALRTMGRRCHSDDIRGDDRAMAGLDPGHFAFLVVVVIVTTVIVAALFGPLNRSLTNLSQNQTSVGPAFGTIVPIVLVLALLVAVVGAVLVTYSNRRGGV